MKHYSIGMILATILLGLFLVHLRTPQPMEHYTLEEWKQSQGQLENYQKPPYFNANSPDDVLNILSYYGFAKRCQMTADQARQLADFVQSLYPTDDSKHPEFYFLLGDFEDNGLPYLRIREFHRKAIPGSPYDQKIVDRDIVISSGDTPQVIFDVSSRERSELVTQHSLGDFVILLHHSQPTLNDWVGKYYAFSDSNIQPIYQFERTYDSENKLWNIIENDKITVYSKKEYQALPPEERYDPLYLELGMDYKATPDSSLDGSNLSLPQLIEALNLYADFLDAETQ